VVRPLLPLLPLLWALATAPPAATQEHDLVLRGATLYRGGLEMAGSGDVAVSGERIVAVGEVPGRGRREIDARGLVVAPGFIDLHNHTDVVYQLAPGWLPLPAAVHEARNYLTQGVTTLVTGNCGSGPATPDAVRGWLRRVDELPYGTNVAHLVPHGDLRSAVLGERASAEPTPEELTRMGVLVDGSLRAGAWGFSTGLEYDPGAHAGTLELVALARVAARHGGIYASHTRHEGPDPARMLGSYAEAIAIGEQAGAPVHISHIKLAGRAVHGMTDEVVALVEAARARGVAVTADQYPYPGGSTTLAMPAPVAMRDGARVQDRYCDEPGARAGLRRGVARFLAENTPPEDLLVSVYPWPWRWTWQGRTVAELARDQERPPLDVAMDLVCGPPGAGIYMSQDEADVRAFMRAPWVATASDGTAMWDFVGRFVHPRVYGTFPRKIRRYALDEPWIGLAFALRSMTELPAKILGLRERGRLEPGAFADLVAFDPDTLRDVATFERSGRHSVGVVHVLVNGVPAVTDGAPTGRRAGRALRRASRMATRAAAAQ